MLWLNLLVGRGGLRQRLDYEHDSKQPSFFLQFLKPVAHFLKKPKSCLTELKLVLPNNGLLPPKILVPPKTCDNYPLMCHCSPITHLLTYKLKYYTPYIPKLLSLLIF
jgi:hypothetical protein